MTLTRSAALCATIVLGALCYRHRYWAGHAWRWAVWAVRTRLLQMPTYPLETPERWGR